MTKLYNKSLLKINLSLNIRLVHLLIYLIILGINTTKYFGRSNVNTKNINTQMRILGYFIHKINMLNMLLIFHYN